MKLKPSKNPLKLLYAIYLGLGVLISFLILYPFIRLWVSRPSFYHLAHQTRKLWGRFVLLFGFIRVKTFFEEPLATKQAYMIVPNHASQLDIVTITVKLPLYFNFMAKAELEKVPLFGIWFRTIDISVDRKDPRKAAQSYRKGLNWLQSGNSMCIFPEGTISNKVPKLIPFKDGPFRMAIEKQIPMLPVTIVNAWKVLPDQGVFEGRPGIITQYIHKPIPTKGLTLNDLEALKEQVFQVINNKLQAHGN